MQETRLQEAVYHPVLPPQAHDLTHESEATRLRALLQVFLTGAVPERAHVHPHWPETIPLQLPRLRQIIQASRQTIHA
jgi:hypothetical protein